MAFQLYSGRALCLVISVEPEPCHLRGGQREGDGLGRGVRPGLLQDGPHDRRLLLRFGHNEEHFLFLGNGDVVEFVDGVLQDKFETIKVDDVLIDGKSSDDVGELVIKDREMLGENGIMLISATLDKQTKKILVGPEVTTRGFIYVKDSYDMIEEIKRISVNIIEANTTPKFVDYNQIKNEIREELSKYFLSETETKPMIIAVIQEV